MPADPTLRLTFDDLRIRVSEYLGIADFGDDGQGDAALPVGTYDLAHVSRLVNNGYRRFLTENPRGWNFMTVLFSITFGTGNLNGDLAQYPAPDDYYGIMLAPFTYGPTGPFLTIDPVTESEVRQRQAANNSTGQPIIYAQRAVNVTASSTPPRWEFVFYPTPQGTETVTAAYKRFPQALVIGSDVPVSGFQHDQAVLEAALAAAELEVTDSIGIHETAYQRELKKALAIDVRSSPSRGRDYGDKSEDRWYGRRPLTYYGVDTYDGVPIR